MIEGGVGTQIDIWAAGEWYQKSAIQGSTAGLSSLGLWYTHEDAVQDAAKSRQAYNMRSKDKPHT